MTRPAPALITKMRLARFCLESRLGESDVNVLDWGCGRGRSVARLRELGFNAYGVDVNKASMAKAFSLLREGGHNPEKILMQVEDLHGLTDHFFDVIFSEEVLEHVRHMRPVAAEMWRLTKPGGIGIHSFPGAWVFREVHLQMPIVHWLPKNGLRKFFILLFVVARTGKGSAHIQTQSNGILARTEAYYQFANTKTYYRNTRTLREIFQGQGFHVEIVTSIANRLRWIPRVFRENGFPCGEIALLLRKPSCV